MKLHIFESTYHGLRCVKAMAVIYKSVKKNIPRNFQKTWSTKTVAPEFTIKEMTPAIEAEAKRWEARIMAALEKTRKFQEECAQERIRLGITPAQTTKPSAADPR